MADDENSLGQIPIRRRPGGRLSVGRAFEPSGFCGMSRVGHDAALNPGALWLPPARCLERRVGALPGRCWWCRARRKAPAS